MINRIANAISTTIIMACLLSAIVWCIGTAFASNQAMIEAACKKQTTTSYKTCIHEATR